MPRYFMHIEDRHGRIEDEEGSELPNLAAAREEALASARQMWAAAILKHHDLGTRRFLVTESGGATVLTMSFDEALPEGLRERLGPVS